MQKPSVAVLLKLAWPIIVSRSTQTVVGLCDALFVAHLGESALAATSAGALNTFVLLILPMGTVFIVSSYASQMFGRGDATGARRYGFYGLWVALATQLLSIAAIVAVPHALGLLDYSSNVRILMSEYLQVRLWCAGAAIGLEALGNYYGGLGNTRTPMVANLGLMALNVVLCWLLVDGNFGFPAMGVKGSALAAAVATWTAFLGLLIYFLKSARVQDLRGDIKEFGRMLRFGLPSGFNWFFEFFAFNFFVNVVVTGLGTTSLAAMMAVLQLNSASFMPAFGLASAGSILVGQAIGAKAIDEVPRLVRMTFAASLAWQAAAAGVYLLMPRLLLAPFAKGNEAMLDVGARMLMLSAAWGGFDAAATTLAEALRAAGDTAYTLWARLLIAWLVFVPGSYFTVRYFGGGDVGALLWLVAYLALLALALFVRFRAGAWRKVELFSGEGALAGPA